MRLLPSLLLLVLVLLFPSLCAQGVRDGLALAAGQALPALFPFFLASGLLIRSGADIFLARLIARPLRALFGLPPAAAGAVLLGLIGGYPVGACALAELTRQNALSPADAKRAALFCNCTSPGLCIGFVGAGLYQSAALGAALYGIHAVAALICGLLLARSHAPKEAAPPLRAAGEPFSVAFCGAVQQAASTALTVTAFLTVFSVLIAFFQPLLQALPYGAALSALLELTTGLLAISHLTLPAHFLLPLLSFLIGFGGLAVQFQLRAVLLPAGICPRTLLRAKLLHGALAAALTAILLRLHPTALPVFSSASMHSLPQPSSAAAILLFCTLIAIWAGNKPGNTI